MRLTQIAVQNHPRIGDLSLQVREHMVIVGANDVGKSSLLRLLNLLLGASSAQLFASLSVKDIDDETVPLQVSASFSSFTSEERRVFHREIDIAADDKSESLEVRLEATVDPEDEESVVIERWCPGRGEVRSLTREQLEAIAWRFISASRGSAASALDGPTGAIRILLRAVEDDLGDEKSGFAELLETFNQRLASSEALTELRGGVAAHLSSSMPRTVTRDDLAVRTTSDPNESVLETVSLFIAGADGAFAPMTEQSDGIRQLMAMTLFDLAEGAANTIAIDEPELHLHPLSQRTVAGMLTSNTTQKVVATHSPYVVQRFDPTQVVAVGPDSRSRQIDPDKFPVNERTQAHWWSPRMLEALTSRFVILVEGVADRLIVEAAASARDLSLDRIGATVFELGGAENFKTVYRLLGPSGFGVTVLGLVDKAESGRWIGAVGGKPKNVVDVVVFVSNGDLEEEYCTGIGAERVSGQLIAAGVANEVGILSSCGVSALEDIDPLDLANFCRTSSKSTSRKVPSALAVARAMTSEHAAALTSIALLLDRLERLCE